MVTDLPDHTAGLSSVVLRRIATTRAEPVELPASGLTVWVRRLGQLDLVDEGLDDATLQRIVDLWIQMGEAPTERRALGLAAAAEATRQATMRDMGNLRVVPVVLRLYTRKAVIWPPVVETIAEMETNPDAILLADLSADDRQVIMMYSSGQGQEVRQAAETFLPEAGGTDQGVEPVPDRSDAWSTPEPAHLVAE